MEARSVVVRLVIAGSLATALAACGDDDDGPVAPGGDAGALTDTGSATDDAPSEGDAGGADASRPCAGACAELTLSATFGGTTRAFDRAFYGITAAAVASSGAPELHVEATAGGGETCPTDSSPTPDRTLVVDGVPPGATAALDESSGVSVSLLDFTGELLPDAPIARATALSVTVAFADVCVECVGGAPPSDPDGAVALDVTATFAEGAAAGHVYAVHCDSMDLAGP